MLKLIVFKKIGNGLVKVCTVKVELCTIRADW